MSYYDRELEKTITEAAGGAGQLLKELAADIYYGLKYLLGDRKTRLPFLAFLAVWSGIGVTLYDWVSSHWLQMAVFYGLPILITIFAGQIIQAQRQRIRESFLYIGFKDGAGRTPYLVDSKTKNKYVTYIFKSDIPLVRWLSESAKLQTALDCNIVDVRQGKSKKIVEVQTLPTDVVIPTYLPWEPDFIHEKENVYVVGQTAVEQVQFDIAKSPHVLCAGQTGGGKSVLLRSLINQAYHKYCRVYLMDFKGGVEFGTDFEVFGLPVISELEDALPVLEKMVAEIKLRLLLFRQAGVKNLEGYNKRNSSKPLCRVIVAVDELAEMMDMTGANSAERGLRNAARGLLSTIARLGRAPGVHLLLGIQRPDAQVVTGQIKNNVPVRICGPFPDPVASEIVLGNTRAFELDAKVKGRMLFQDGAGTIEFQSYLFEDWQLFSDQEFINGYLAHDFRLLTDDRRHAAAVSRLAASPDPEPEDYIFEYDD